MEVYCTCLFSACKPELLELLPLCTSIDHRSLWTFSSGIQGLDWRELPQEFLRLNTQCLATNLPTNYPWTWPLIPNGFVNSLLLLWTIPLSFWCCRIPLRLEMVSLILCTFRWSSPMEGQPTVGGCMFSVVPIPVNFGLICISYMCFSTIKRCR